MRAIAPMGYGRGKVILLGEHGVVFGRPALATALDRGVRAQAEEAAADRLEVAPWGVSVGPAARADEPLAEAFARALSLYERRGGAGVCVRADVELPGGAGLGCSAALGVAVIAALDAYHGVRRTGAERAQAAHAWETVFHGNPSGIDAAMAALGGTAVYRRGEGLTAVKAHTTLPLVVAHSGEPSSTRAMVAAVASQHARARARVDQTFDAMASLVRNARLALEAGDLGDLGRFMDHNQALLSSLLVSTVAIEDLCDRARSAGALGAKLTGGGGGGCIIALAKDAEAAQQVRGALAEHAPFSFVVAAGASA